jgi:hypothetical protein
MSDEQTPEEIAAAAKAVEDAKNAEWQGKLDALTADNDRLTAKISESNKHTKAAEAKAAKEEKERLEGANNFEQLYKSSEAEREGLIQQIADRDLKAASTNEDNAALTLANELTKDTKRARLLAKELKGRLKYTEDGIKVTDVNGNLTVSSLDDLKLEVQKNPDYDFLIDGVESSGGGAGGSNNNGGATINPFKKGEHFNLTKQGEISKSDPALAAQLKASA